MFRLIYWLIFANYSSIMQDYSEGTDSSARVQVNAKDIKAAS